MAKKSLRLNVGSIFTKGPGKIYLYRYQVDGCRKTVSLQTANRAEAIKKTQELLPVVHASSVDSSCPIFGVNRSPTPRVLSSGEGYQK